MSGIIPTSPTTRGEGLLHTESKQPAKPAASKPAVDTLETTGESSGVLFCLQSFASSIWSYVSDFFAWAISLVYNPPNPELLKGPLKQMTEFFPAWRSENGPIKTMIEKMREVNQYSSFDLQIQLRCYIAGSRSTALEHFWSSARHEKIGTHPSREREDVPSIFQPAFDQFLKNAKQAFEQQKGYIDFARGDLVVMQMQGTLDNVENQATIVLIQRWENGVAQPIEIY